MVSDLEREVRSLLIKARSPYNDGYTQEIYLKILRDVQKLLNDELKEKTNAS